MDRKDLELLLALQNGISIESRPFKRVADLLESSEAEVLDRLTGMIQSGRIRRFAASLSHRRIGYGANAMCVWDVPDDRVEEVGKLMAGFKEVSHCYLRPRRRHWRFNIFTMIHGRSRKFCIETAKSIAEAVKIEDYEVLFSRRELKKTGVRLGKLRDLS